MTPEADARRRELMDELRRRFQDSSAAMRRIARRIQEAADASSAVDRRARAASAPLAEHVDAAAAGTCFSYLEFLEFSGPAEFDRFRHAPPLTERDVRNVDWDELGKRLLENPGGNG